MVRQDAEASASPFLEVRGLTKRFGYRLVLRGLDLTLKSGSFLVILGPNGAGKSTLLKILATLVRPTSGEVRLAGLDLRKETTALRCRIGFVGHQTYLYDDLTVSENLRFYGRLFGVPHLGERIQEVLGQVGLWERRQERVRTLSHGLQKRASIARALLPQPDVFLFDEPEAGLDQEAVAQLWQVLDSLDQGQGIVLMTTHNLERGLEWSNRVAILSGGRLAFQEERKALTREDLARAYRTYTEGTEGR